MPGKVIYNRLPHHPGRADEALAARLRKSEKIPSKDGIFFAVTFPWPAEHHGGVGPGECIPHRMRRLKMIRLAEDSSRRPWAAHWGTSTPAET
jgi:hypothetical protein